VAEKAGEKAAATALRTRLASLAKVARVLAVYELAKNTLDLVVAIKSGDWHQIGQAQFTFVSAAGGVAVQFGIATGATAAGVTGVAFLAWVEIEVVLMVGEQLRWLRAYEQLQKVRNLLADTKKIVPMGKKMAAAAQLMLEAGSGKGDDVEAAEVETHKREAMKLAGYVGKDLRLLADKYFSTGPDSVSFLLPANHPAGTLLSTFNMHISQDDPLSLSEAFKVLLGGIKAVVDEGDRLYGKEVEGV
jgi:hypothetical protein